MCEPFLGTGTFVTRLLQSGIIPAEKLEHKYLHEIFANEIVLLSYYIASINIEQVYHEIRKEQGFPDEYVEFPGITLTDTFQLREEETPMEGLGDFQPNIERIQRQQEAPIRVVVMNPPYSAGQDSANDDNQNLKYAKLDARIAATYAERSTATNKNSLYDSYFRALRWATDRIGEEGVIAFVSNSSFIDGNTADGVRLTWQEEFSDIYVYNLRGAVRGKMGDVAAREGGNVFQIMTGVAITLLVKTSHKRRRTNVMFAETPDYLSHREKLDVLEAEKSVLGTEFARISPNEHGDWLNQRDEKYLEYQAIGDGKTKGKPETPAIFLMYSAGLQTNRDAWVYNFSRRAVETNMRNMIANYNAQVSSGVKSMDATKVSWSSSLDTHFNKRKTFIFNPEQVQMAIYRPFCKQPVYFDRHLNHRPYQLPQIFPTQGHPNLSMALTGPGSAKEFATFMHEDLPDLHMLGAGVSTQIFSLYTWHPVSDEYGFDLAGLTEYPDAPTEFSGTFDFNRPIGSQVPLEVGGYRRRDNITDATLVAYRSHYSDGRNPRGERISKEDIFFYVYALLHHPEYREKYAADLKKMLPRIPKVSDFWSYVNVGRELAELHVNYETVEPYPGVEEEWSMILPDDEWQKYRVEKMKWAKLPSSAVNKRQKDKNDYSTLIYNAYLQFTGIPVEANEYKIGGRSPLEWVVDRYKITTHKASQIVNDPNDYCREINDPAYIANLVPRLVTVSMRTQALVASLPELVIEE
ncbi:type ISP restriction/modification enzyme [Trueperella pecoris]|uniref:type ISP restriction/modification enzyme n=1 Tax=Trueperella pecoris TaxID=2733571 RepID=UPI0021003D48|nr:type ISP restriction/modification enzyme [Trueperella pecoris]